MRYRAHGRGLPESEWLRQEILKRVTYSKGGHRAVGGLSLVCRRAKVTLQSVSLFMQGKREHMSFWVAMRIITELGIPLKPLREIITAGKDPDLHF